MATNLNEIYNTDIETVMDFMKLSILFDNPKTDPNNLKTIIELQKSILELLPVAQSERMASVYTLLVEVYHQNKKDINKNVVNKNVVDKNVVDKNVIDKNVINKNVVVAGTKDSTQTQQIDKKLYHFIILFYKSSCPACKKIMPHWNEFKRLSVLRPANFTIIEYDSDDKINAEIFQRFKIEDVPTVVKLRLDRDSNYAEGMTDSINVNNLLKFGIF
jgi:thiol-disulfide isomerase/thioredoxin